MFLIETGVASDWEAAKGMIQRIMDRSGVELVACRQWDERRLAYDINRRKRATYILCYFRSDGSAIGSIERDVQLSEHLLRVLLLRADHITPEMLEEIKALPEQQVHGSQELSEERERPEWRPARRQRPSSELDEAEQVVQADADSLIKDENEES